MDNIFLTPEQEAYLHADVTPDELHHQEHPAKKLSKLAIDTANPQLLKDTLDVVTSRPTK